MAKVSFNIIDHSDEYSKCEFNIPDADETVWVGQQTEIAALRAAILIITTGNLAYETLVAYKHHINDARPTNENSQREIGLRLFLKDTVTGEKSHVTIPSPNLPMLSPGGSDSIDLNGSEAAALVTAIQTLIRSKLGNPVSIYKGIIVGRKN